MEPESWEFLRKAARSAARIRMEHSNAHKAIALENGKIAKAFGTLADEHDDRRIVNCCKSLSSAHKALAAHHNALASTVLGQTIEKPGDEEDGGTAEKRLPFVVQPAAYEKPYGGPGSSVTARTAAMLDLMDGHDDSIDPLSKSVWNFDDNDMQRTPTPRTEGDVLAKRVFADVDAKK